VLNITRDLAAPPLCRRSEACPTAAAAAAAAATEQQAAGSTAPTAPRTQPRVTPPSSSGVLLTALPGAPTAVGDGLRTPPAGAAINPGMQPEAWWLCPSAKLLSLPP